MLSSHRVNSLAFPIGLFSYVELTLGYPTTSYVFFFFFLRLIDDSYGTLRSHVCGSVQCDQVPTAAV